MPENYKNNINSPQIHFFEHPSAIQCDTNMLKRITQKKVNVSSAH